MAALAAIVRANDVLPTPGRAARMIRSEFWRPFVSWSSSVIPVGTPVIPSLRLFRRSRSGVTKFSMGLREFLTCFSAMAKTSLSAACRTSSGLLEASIAFLMVSDDILMSLRSTYLLRRCWRFQSTFADDATLSIISKMYSRPPALERLPSFSSSAGRVSMSMGVPWP